MRATYVTLWDTVSRAIRSQPREPLCRVRAPVVHAALCWVVLSAMWPTACVSGDGLSRTCLTAIVDDPSGAATVLSGPGGRPVGPVRNGIVVSVEDRPTGQAEAADRQNSLVMVTTRVGRGVMKASSLKALVDIYMPSARTPDTFVPANTGSANPVRLRREADGTVRPLALPDEEPLAADPLPEDVSQARGETPADAARMVIATSEESQSAPNRDWLDASKPFAALPHSKVLGMKISIQQSDAEGRGFGPVLKTRIRDVGPWRTDDAYWERRQARPAVEGLKGQKVVWDRARKGWYPSRSGTTTCNGAGLDVSFGGWMKLIPGISKEQALRHTGRANWWGLGWSLLDPESNS
jgi:hypothetical protein